VCHNVPVMLPASSAPLDLVYLFRHSMHGDRELLYSLRSVARHLPYIRKVWIFGDRPAFLTVDTSRVEHVPHAYLAPLLNLRLPVRNDFLMLALASFLPDLAHEFVRFSDDYIVLEAVPRAALCTPRVLEDLSRVAVRGTSPFQQQLWRTYDLLREYGYPGYNFESHTPQPYTRKRVFEAFMAFRRLLSEERYGGMVSATAIGNYAIRHSGLEFTWLGEARAGIYRQPPSQEEVAAACRGKSFLNFDDAAWGPGR